MIWLLSNLWLIQITQSIHTPVSAFTVVGLRLWNWLPAVVHSTESLGHFDQDSKHTCSPLPVWHNWNQKSYWFVGFDNVRITNLLGVAIDRYQENWQNYAVAIFSAQFGFMFYTLHIFMALTSLWQPNTNLNHPSNTHIYKKIFIFKLVLPNN